MEELSYRAGRHALCTNLAVTLLSSSSASPPTGQEAPDGARPGAAQARAIAAEAVQLQPGSRTATLLAAYMDMSAGRCDSALGLLRTLQG